MPPSRSFRRTTRRACFATMPSRVSFLILATCAAFAVAAQTDLPPAEVLAPGPASSELPLPDAPLVELVDPPRRRRAEADRDDAAAPGPGPSLAETPLNCSSIEGVTGNMPGVELFYERASRQVERSQKKKLFLRYIFYVFFFYAYALRTPSLTATPAPQSPSSAASSPWSCPAACSTR